MRLLRLPLSVIVQVMSTGMPAKVDLKESRPREVAVNLPAGLRLSDLDAVAVDASAVNAAVASAIVMIARRTG
jgi:hypothetical protein